MEWEVSPSDRSQAPVNIFEDVSASLSRKLEMTTVDDTFHAQMVTETDRRRHASASAGPSYAFGTRGILAEQQAATPTA